MSRLILAIVALLALAPAAQAGGVVVPAEQRYSAYSGKIPACDDGSVMADISTAFASKEAGFWNSSLTILGAFDQVKEIGFRANGLGYIPRRYCVANAHFNDGRDRRIVYQVQEDLGPIGWAPGVEWCVVGTDRDFAYAPACSALRPFVQRYLNQKPLQMRF